jgi:hypothetical protein
LGRNSRREEETPTLVAGNIILHAFSQLQVGSSCEGTGNHDSRELGYQELGKTVKRTGCKRSITSHTVKFYFSFLGVRQPTSLWNSRWKARVVVGVIGKETSAHQLIIRTNFLAVGCTQ